MAPPPVLPSMFDAALRAGASTTPTLQLNWTGDRLEVQGEAVQLRVGWSELVSMQVSRSASQRRRWWGGDAVTHRVHAELRTRQGMRVRLSAVVSSPDRLDGLPWMEGAGIDIPEEALVGLIATAQHAGVKLVEWGEEVMKPPPAELQRRRELEERAARAARKRQRAAEKAAKAEQARERSEGAAAKPTEGEGAKPSVRVALLITVGLTLVVLVAGAGWTQLSMGWGLDVIHSVVAIPGDADHLVVIGENRLDENTGTRLIVLDLRSGEEVASAVWRAGFFSPTRPARVLGELDGLLWLCGGAGEIEGWDMRTLTPKVLLTQQAGADASLREAGLLDPAWMSCESSRVRVDARRIEIYTNQGQWVSLYEGVTGGALPSCSGHTRSLAALDAAQAYAVQWDGPQGAGLSLVEGSRRGSAQRLKHAPHIGGAVLLDGLTCTAAQASDPASVFLLWRDRLDRPMNQLSRIPLDDVSGELWSVTAPVSEASPHFAASRGRLLLLGRERDDPGIAALDVETGAVRWRWEP